MGDETVDETDDVTVISATGDLILEVSHGVSSSPPPTFRVDSERLCAASPYFSRLLSDRFAEGQRFRKRRAELLSSHGTAGAAPHKALPAVAVADLGRISRVSAVGSLARDFLRALHGAEVAPRGKLPLVNLANLLVVADRFDALPVMTGVVRRGGFVEAIDVRAGRRGAGADALGEERQRQRVLCGFFLGHDRWLAVHTRETVLGGSMNWGKGYGGDGPGEALWWDLPGEIEDELAFRRSAILETIRSLQLQLLEQYLSGARQCRLFYDSSPACDAFQLGEAVRFFTRIGTLGFRSLVFDADADTSARSDPAPVAYTGDVRRLLEALRQCPAYQVDANHSHCGMRARLLPLLDLLLAALVADAGLCSECWRQRRADYAWRDAKPPLHWKRADLPDVAVRSPAAAGGCKPERHRRVRDMFLAVERDWMAGGTGATQESSSINGSLFKKV